MTLFLILNLVTFDIVGGLMLEILYFLTLTLVLFTLKSHPTSLIFVFLINFMSGFTPVITTFVDYELVLFDHEMVIQLLLVFNLSITILHTVSLFLKKRSVSIYILKKYKYSKLVLYFFSLFSMLVVYQNVSQGFEVLSNGYIAGYKSASEQTIKATSLFPFLLIFYFLIFSRYLNDNKLYYLIIMLVIIISYSMYGSRSFFLYSFISIMAFLLVLKKITYKKCFSLSILLLPIIVIAGALREGISSEGVTILLRMAIELANIPMIISNLDVISNLDQSLLMVILTTLPQSIIVPLGVEPLNSLATEFAVAYDPGWAEAGGGFGFSFVAEIYYRFGYVGLVFVPFVVIKLLHKLEDKFLQGDDFDKALILTGYYGMLMWVRGDFIEISRLLLIVLFFYYSKRLVYRNGK
ncbi:oligosaccharide repeat unit polymerase [Vibrio parahaemolyticus]|nr:oligosaccharide repeat unit polymerase [Vibrio parahaemolyticus]EIV8630170.1 oligosaccharide repeat unit polymerase [Vibrio parahaemolyticus]EJG0976284.1 oligosaccharide repeat unit polymerase [Vibrio parahaemolyticus]EJG1019888.1 oligosaccharide repeat unit polymerase [Vibrio parahaemolyticus]ELA9446093.1 oligosaccharide repeat unit polymerase [Vibrio parahaemolyticus]